MTTRMGDVFYLFMSEGISDQQHHGMKIIAVCSSMLVLLTTFSLSNAHSKIVFDLDEGAIMFRNDNNSGHYIFHNDELRQVKEGELLDWMNEFSSFHLGEGATKANPWPSRESGAEEWFYMKSDLREYIEYFLVDQGFLPKGHSYDKDAIYQLKIRGSYGRYLTFSGRTPNEYAGTGGSYNPGSSGREVCSTNSGMSPTLTLNQGAGRRYSYNYARSSHTNCRTEGYEAPSYKPGTSGGIQAQSFRYELDCKDMTFDRKGDMLDANGAMKGWMNVSADPTAQVVANKYCGIISSLPKSND